MAIVVKSVMEKTGMYKIDEFGVVNYSVFAIALFSILAMTVLVCSLGYVTYLAELGAENANIANYTDALWLMLMSSSTIGFGDHYPVTLVGRAMVLLMFVLGVGILGGIGAIFAGKVFGFSDTNVKNRELRKQNDQILKKLIELEAQLDKLTKK